MYVDADAVRKNHLLRKITNAEVEGAVKLWLRFAADRSGGRAERCTKSISAVPRVSVVRDTSSDSD
jgi:hypothetical protein